MNTHNIKASLFMAVLILGTLSACKKDTDNGGITPGTTAPTCLPSEMSMTGQMGTFKSSLQYNAAKQFIESKTISPWGTSGITYTYDANGKVSVVEEYDGTPKEVSNRTTYTYAAGKISEEKKYADMNGTMELYEILRYEYAGNKISKVKSFEIINGQENETGYMTYTFDANGNVSKIAGFIDDGQGGTIEYMRRSFTYDTQPAQWAMLTFITYDPNFPAKNMLIQDKTELYDTDTQQWEVDDNQEYSFTYNSDKLPVTVSVIGFGSGSITYTCK